jgi:uncharacterized protein YneF (UPF0154 family)
VRSTAVIWIIVLLVLLAIVTGAFIGMYWIIRSYVMA